MIYIVINDGPAVDKMRAKKQLWNTTDTKIAES